MQTHVSEHRGYEIAVQPEWLTQEEAVRDGIEWGTRFVDRKLEESHDLM